MSTGGGASRLVAEAYSEFGGIRSLAVSNDAEPVIFFSDQSLDCVGIDGGNRGGVASGHEMFGTAVGSQSVFWTVVDRAGGNGTLNSANENGSEMRILAEQLSIPTAVTVDGTRVYWASAGTGAGEGTIMSSLLDGGAQITLASGQNHPTAIVASGGSVYWANNAGTVMRTTPDGGPPSPIAIQSGSGYDANFVGGLAVDGAHVYWTNAVDGTVVRADLDGGSQAVLWNSPALGKAAPAGIVVDDTSVYWADRGDDGAIRRLTPK